ncbi:MAG: TRAP transporter small permease subunit [Pseudomonadota bacterium]
MERLSRLAGGIDAFVDAVGRVSAWSTFALVLVMAGNVLLRYVFSTGSVWSQELEWHLMSPICLIGMSYALRHGEHVRVDILYAGLSARAKPAIDLLSALAAVAIALVVIHLSWGYIAQSWSIGEGSANPGGIPYRYLLKALIPVGFALFLLQSLAWAIRSLMALRGG